MYGYSKMQPKIENFVDIKTGSEDLAENEVEIKNEVKEIKWIENDYISYENFKLKNEEIDLKLECEGTNQLTPWNESDSFMNSVKKEEEQEMNYLEINDLEVKQYNCLDCEMDSHTNEIKKSYKHHPGNSVGNNELMYDLKMNIKNEDLTSERLTCNNTNHESTKKCRNIETRKLYECHLCDYQTVVKGRLSLHKLTHGITDGFQNLKCSHCTYETFNKTNFIYHIKTHHKITNFKCDQCDYQNVIKGPTNISQILKCCHCSFETFHKSSLTNHMKAHKNNKDFKCTYCSKEFSSKLNLDSHLLNVHKCSVTRKLHKCDQCNYVNVAKKRLLQHKLRHGAIHSLQILKCYHCNFETFYKGNLIQHVQIHKNIKDFKCSYCSKEFSHKINFDYHLLKIHKCNITRKLYKCDQCSYVSMTKYSLSKHKLKHGIRDGFQIFKCSHCTYETFYKSNFNSHIKTHHKIKDIKCDQCDYPNMIKDQLSLHKLKRDKTNSQILKCCHCNFETVYKSSLKNHMKIHKNIKDFKCTYCSKKFSQKINLDSHLLRIHKCNITRKLYKCDQCSYLTVTKRSLLKHKLNNH